jgi:PAS domain S-box-containing protein
MSDVTSSPNAARPSRSSARGAEALAPSPIGPAAGLELEVLVAELSSRFLALPPAEVDDAIADALRRVCETAGLEGCVLWQRVPGPEEGFSATHALLPPREDQGSLPPFGREWFPWGFERVRAGEPLAIPAIEDLPAAAVRDRETWRSLGAGATAVFPLSAGGGPPSGLLSFQVSREPFHWPEPLVRRLTFIAQILANALARKSAGVRLHESETRLLSAIGIAELGFYEAGEGGRIHFLDERTRELFAIPPGEDERTREIWLASIHPDDREMMRDASREVLSGGSEVLARQYRYLHPRRGEIWLDHLSRTVARSSEGLPLRIVGVVKDVSIHKRHEAHLLDALDFNRSILSSIRDGIAILDREGVIIAINEAWERNARGSDRPAALSRGTVGTRYLQVCREAGAPDVAEGVESVLEGTRDLFRHEYEAPSAKDPRWFQLEVMPLRRARGGAVVIHSDISARKKTEAELRRLRLDIWHAHRVSQTSAIAASLAHELNQPLAAILSNAQAGQQILSDPQPDLGEIRDILEDIVQDDKRAASVIVGLRAMMRRKETQREPVELGRLVEDVLTLVRNEFLQHAVSVALRLEGEAPLSADRAQLQQVILNLVMNAIEAMEEAPAGDRTLDISLARMPDAHALLAFRDRGEGIPADEQAKVFDSFWTTKSQGMGIGLPICRSIIESHGGQLWFETNEDRGVTFFVSLPLALTPAT